MEYIIRRCLDGRVEYAYNVKITYPNYNMDLNYNGDHDYSCYWTTKVEEAEKFSYMDIEFAKEAANFFDSHVVVYLVIRAKEVDNVAN